MSALAFLDIPIVQAPMGGATTPELVAAVSNAGGLGSLPLGYTGASDIEGEIAKVRALTSRPFAANLFVESGNTATAEQLQRAHDRLRTYREELGIPHPASPPQLKLSFRAQFAAVLRARPAVFSFTFGIPPRDVLDACRDAGIVTIGTAKTVEEAVALEESGVDLVCAQGYEAGGHHGPFIAPAVDSSIGVLALTPQIVDAVRIPVLAAGGIGDGRGLAAVLALGATAAQIGSAFLRSDETGASPAYRAALAAPGGRRTTLTDVFTGRTARGVRNRFIDEMTGDADIAPYPYQHELTRDIRAAAAAQGRSEFVSLWSGQAVTLAKAIPAAEIVRLLLEEARIASAVVHAALH